MTTILLIRHGLNDWVGKKLVGRTPGIHLNKAGESQAQTIASLLKDIPINAIYSSPLERARETAQPLSTEISVPIITKDALQEINSFYEEQWPEYRTKMEQVEISPFKPVKNFSLN